MISKVKVNGSEKSHGSPRTVRDQYRDRSNTYPLLISDISQPIPGRSLLTTSKTKRSDDPLGLDRCWSGSVSHGSPSGMLHPSEVGSTFFPRPEGDCFSAWTFLETSAGAKDSSLQFVVISTFLLTNTLPYRSKLLLLHFFASNSSATQVLTPSTPSPTMNRFPIILL